MIVQKLVIFLTFVWEGAGRLRTHVHINDSEINIKNSRKKITCPNLWLSGLEWGNDVEEPISRRTLRPKYAQKYSAQLVAVIRGHAC